jgi:hypothetical protein
MQGGRNMKVPETKVNINFKILPFGHAQIEIRGGEETKEAKLECIPVYTEPKTTNQQIIEITFGGEEYRTPKTTGGLL